MSEENTSKKSTSSEKEVKQKEKSPIKPVTYVVLGICVILLVWYLASNRHTPYSNSGRLSTLVVPIVPKVSGYLEGIYVGLHSKVNEGDTLFQIDKKVFRHICK